MRRVLAILLILIASSARAAQLQSCLEQTDVYTVPINGSTTLSFASFNFDDLTATFGFKGSTTLRIYVNATLPQVQAFATTKTPDALYTTFNGTHHETLLAQNPTTACPLLASQTNAFLLTH